MDALLQTLDKLLTRKVCDATTKALEKLAQAFNRQQKSIADLREEVRILGERVRVLPDREPSLSRIRLSAHDIKVFRKRWHLTQESLHWKREMLTTGLPGWRRQWHPTPVLLPGKSHGWRSPVGCSPWGR